MEVELAQDGESGPLVCRLRVDDRELIVTASNAHSAGADLLAALADARETGYGECVWPVPEGEYRWMLRRAGDRVTVVALWSSGTLTGWQHVLHTETAFGELVAQVRKGLGAAGAGGR